MKHLNTKRQLKSIKPEPNKIFDMSQEEITRCFNDDIDAVSMEMLKSAVFDLVDIHKGVKEEKQND